MLERQRELHIPGLRSVPSVHVSRRLEWPLRHRPRTLRAPCDTHNHSDYDHAGCQRITSGNRPDLNTHSSADWLGNLRERRPVSYRVRAQAGDLNDIHVRGVLPLAKQQPFTHAADTGYTSAIAHQHHFV
jgi:hypothetical protein